MQLKKFALRGMIVLAVVVTLCILFSGTLRTLTTAKVQYAPKKMGKIEQSVELTGTVVFPKQESPITIKVPDGFTLNVTKVHVVKGQKVKADDELITTEIAGVEDKLTELQNSYDEARAELDEWQRKNGDIRLSRGEQMWVDAYNAARDAERAELEVRLSLMTELGVSKSSKLTEKNVSKGSDTAKELYQQWLAAKDEMAAAQKKQADLNRYAVSDDLWKTLQEKQKIEKKQKDAEDQMVRIRLLQKQLGVIRAGHDAYVAEVKVAKDNQLTGLNELIVLTEEGTEPVIRAETKDISKPVQKGADISIIVDEGTRRTVKSKVIATGLMENGTPCVDTEITEEVIRELGTIPAMVKNGNISMKAISRSKDSVCLITASAVHSDGKTDSVYMVIQGENNLGEKVLTISETEVTVLGRNDEWVAVEQEYLSNEYYKIAYMADRPISNGDTVMLYDSNNNNNY